MSTRRGKSLHEVRELLLKVNPISKYTSGTVCRYTSEDIIWKLTSEAVSKATERILFEKFDCFITPTETFHIEQYDYTFYFFYIYFFCIK